jgi:hypothetical protein
MIHGLKARPIPRLRRPPTVRTMTSVSPSANVASPEPMGSGNRPAEGRTNATVFRWRRFMGGRIKQRMLTRLRQSRDNFGRSGRPDRNARLTYSAQPRRNTSRRWRSLPLNLHRKPNGRRNESHQRPSLAPDDWIKTVRTHKVSVALQNERGAARDTIGDGRNSERERSMGIDSPCATLSGPRPNLKRIHAH